jgi:hypothetical protein
MYKGDYCKLCGTHKALTGNWMEVCSDCVRELILDREGYLKKILSKIKAEQIDKEIEIIHKIPESTSGSSFSK